jgi:protein-S-isoprenylcysteine O-methyltransferase Ste14
MSGRRGFWMRWRVRAGYPIAMIYWALATPTSRSILMGSILVAFGLFIRGAAAGHLRKLEELATTGPYASTRNPLYLGSALLAAGFVMAGHSWWAGTIVAVYFAVFYYPVMREEEGELRLRYGAGFETYAASVPLFFPRLFGAAPASSEETKATKIFSWAQYRRNREYQALGGTILGLAAVWLRMWIRTRYGR